MHKAKGRARNQKAMLGDKKQAIRLAYKVGREDRGLYVKPRTGIMLSQVFED